MSIRTNLIRGRSHIIIAVVLIVGGSIVVRIEDRNLQKETGKTPPPHAMLVDQGSAAPTR